MAGERQEFNPNRSGTRDSWLTRLSMRVRDFDDRSMGGLNTDEIRYQKNARIDAGRPRRGDRPTGPGVNPYPTDPRERLDNL
jgi:hypothetical protein